MRQIKIDESLRDLLNGCDADIEMVDESGKPVGHFVPEELYRKMLYAWVESQCPYSEEQLREFQQQKGGMKLAEFWKKMGVHDV